MLKSDLDVYLKSYDILFIQCSFNFTRFHIPFSFETRKIYVDNKLQLVVYDNLFSSRTNGKYQSWNKKTDTDLKSPGFVFCHSCFSMAQLYKLQHENILKDNFPFSERLYLFNLEDIKCLFHTYLCISFTVRASLWVFDNGTDTQNSIQL